MSEEKDQDENPAEISVPVPEVVENSLSPQEKQLIDDAVRFINQTVRGMLLNAALRIGEYLLIGFFNNDIKRAVSMNAHKNTSFSRLCSRPDISLDRRDLGLMVKIAAQERFIRQIDVNTSRLNYTHRKYLTRLPDGETKIDLVDECANGGLSARQLRLRIQEIKNSEKAEGEITTERMIRQFIKQMDRSLENIAIPGTLSEPGFFSGLPPDTRMELQGKTMQWLEQMESIRSRCTSLLEMLKNDENTPP